MNPKKRREEKIARQKTIINLAKEEQRDLSAEEQRELDALQREIDLLQGADGEAQQQEGQKDEPDTEGSARMAVENERKRAEEISTLCREFGMEAEKFIKGGNSVDQVRKEVINKLRAENPPVASRGTGDIEVRTSSEDKFRAAAADALLMRGGVTIEKPAPGASDLRAISLRDLAIETLQSEGHSGLNRKSSDELFMMLQRAYFNPSASFTAIMDTAINKAYVEGHRSVNVTFDKIVKKGSLKDFKTHDNKYLAGPAGEFLEVPEGGELKHDKPVDEKMPTRKLKTYGRQFTMTREAFINDDIDFLSKIPSKYAAAARKTQNKQVYQILCKNPAIYDGTPMFSASHKNILASGTGVTREALMKMIAVLQTQTDQFGEAIIINPATIVVPSGYAFDIYAVLYSPTIHTEGNTQSVNPLYRYRDLLEVVEEPTINVLCGGFGNEMPWFLVGAKSDTDFIEVDYLNGQEIPIIRRMEVAGQLGYVWDMYLDWGVSVMDYRGAVKNKGIVVESPLD